MPTLSNPRSVEEWAKTCRAAGHPFPAPSTCNACIRAYAAEQVAQARAEELEVLDAASLVAKWVAHSPQCSFSGCTCESAERLPDALNDFHRKRRAAIRRREEG